MTEGMRLPLRIDEIGTNADFSSAVIAQCQRIHAILGRKRDTELVEVLRGLKRPVRDQHQRVAAQSNWRRNEGTVRAVAAPKKDAKSCQEKNTVHGARFNA
jgi:hypothetical protein